MTYPDLLPEFSPADPAVKTVDIPLVAAGGRITVQVFTAPGSQYVGTIIKTEPLVGDYPDWQVWNLLYTQQARNIARWIRVEAIRALRRDGAGESQPMPIPTWFTDNWYQVLVASRDELENVARALQSCADIADQVFS